MEAERLCTLTSGYHERSTHSNTQVEEEEELLQFDGELGGEDRRVSESERMHETTRNSGDK